MSVIGSNILAGASGPSGYDIDNSLRCYADANTSVAGSSLTRTPGSAGNKKTWTFSCWIKRGRFSGNNIFSAFTNSSNRFSFGITADDYFFVYSLGPSIDLKSTAVYRDPSAWYHVVITMDTTISSPSADRVRVYINGEAISLPGNTSGSHTEPSEDDETEVNSTTAHYVGGEYSTSTSTVRTNFDGYLADVCFIDGQALTPSSFAETNALTNQWIPKNPIGLTFGTNGFYQKYGTSGSDTSFDDSSSSDHTITRNNDVIHSRAQKKIGDSSILFDGSGDSLQLAAHADWDFGTGAYTVESWIKTSDQASQFIWHGAGSANTDGFRVRVQATDGLLNLTEQESSNDHVIRSTTALNDGNWHHWAISRASSGNAKMFIDGVLEATMDANYNTDNNNAQMIGIKFGGNEPMNGYIDELRVSKGVARYTATFTDFGQGGGTISSPTAFTADSDTKLLIHSSFDGGLGFDSSGRGNNFTATNLVVTDQMTDTPTNSWCIYNPLAKMPATGAAAASEGNLKIISSSWGGFKSSFVVPKTGKFYCEVYVGGTTNGSNTNVSGLVPGIQDHYTDTGVYAWFSNDGVVRYSNSDLTTTTGPATGDIMSWYVNNGEVKIYLNNVLKYTYGTNLSAVDDDYFFYTQSVGASHFATVNFGQDSSFAGVKTAQNNDDDGDATADWYYAPPTDVESLCSDNLSDPSIPLPEENFKTIKWTGTDGSRDHTGVGFSPGFVYIKNSTGAAGYSHQWYDTVRGVGKMLRADTSAAEITNNSEGYLDSFDADGFSTVAGSTNNDWTNDAAHNYHAWNWRIPTAFSGSTAGSGTSKSYTGIKNPDAGMSIVKYTGNGTNGHFIPHGLGKAPEMTILRNVLTSSGAADVEQYEVLGYNHFTSIYHTVKLDVSPVQADGGSGQWVNAVPDATHVKLGSVLNTNANNEVFNMWNFANIEGYQKVGTFVGNSSTDGTFIYLGFKPSLLWLAPITNVTDGNWNFVSDGENGVTNYNVISNTLLIDVSSNQNTDNTMDLVSNGFKMRKNSAYWNHTSTTMFYLAIAARPFKYSNGR